MSPMARSAARRAANDEYFALWDATPRPPSGALINVILEHADIHQDVGSGRTVLRMSDRRIAACGVRRRLGPESRRLSEISVLWDEEAGQIVGILDDGAEGERAFWPCQDLDELDTFELTE